MHYLIDGHNLIGQCRTIHLADPDDEAKLVDALHRWVLRFRHHQVTVVFDGSVPGYPHTLDRSGVRVLFARSPDDADARLIHLIKRINAPQRYRVVSSDRAVAAAARERGIQVIRAEAFAAELEAPRPAHQRGPSRPRPEPKLSRTEVDAWLREFGVDDPPQR
ncbi:NYN domain-containing protein [Kallotenue papyrolyticum]|uniref:NYN domain-containing protein n=1 Tax=Kallotenue papyrolyticum TaxID=1325125 RepID=UPI000478608D|nr:NYN domain-containing protein [Kallotenue papyrolyticum]